MMQVTAPATLPEGYEFDVRIGDRTVTVTVPKGGVEKGQMFSVPLPERIDSLITGSINIPVGHWRDGLFDIFHYGACHPAAWASCCCPLCKYYCTCYQVLDSTNPVVCVTEPAYFIQCVR